MYPIETHSNNMWTPMSSRWAGAVTWWYSLSVKCNRHIELSQWHVERYGSWQVETCEETELCWQQFFTNPLPNIHFVKYYALGTVKNQSMMTINQFTFLKTLIYISISSNKIICVINMNIISGRWPDSHNENNMKSLDKRYKD